ncbi:hypothetical protein QEG98_31400 [Myxococcus sp. MxC21-1]|nr:hypothetical protein [Myxococcus sp. MxC21-1]WNZ60452.1 hypothetical protein QEG98_31400 [Myxococcus sp. MxC21-1]
MSSSGSRLTRCSAAEAGPVSTSAVYPSGDTMSAASPWPTSKK